MWKTRKGLLMWAWFRRSEESADEGSPKGGIEALRMELREHEVRLKALETEWGAVYQKLSKLVGHITKSAALSTNNQPPAAEPSPAPPPPRQRSADDLSRDEIAALPWPK